MNNNNIMVSVIVLTYNHELYVRQALDSILMQKTCFDFEIIVGDDCSQDNTRKILKEYKAKYPHKIKLLLYNRNVGGTRNAHIIKTHTRGKYLAALEGDDYWNDEYKLQKQVDYLEENPCYYACSHQVTVVDKHGVPIEEKNNITANVFWKFHGSNFGLSDFEKGYYSGHASTILARNYYLDNSLDKSIFYKYHNVIGDRTVQMILALKGDTYVMNESMGCYRCVEDKNGANWQSMARARNRRYEEFNYICNLERYARNKLGRKVDLSAVKKDKLICAVVVFMNTPNKENLKVVCKIIRVSKQPIGMSLLAIRAILLKIYYRKVLKEDRPIKL